MKNFDIDIDFENQISENIDIDIERKFDIVPCLLCITFHYEYKPVKIVASLNGIVILFR